jgi:hypothetical protein
MKLASLAVAALVMSASAPSMAAGCTSTFSLGTLAPAGGAGFANMFTAPQHFNDCYLFTLSTAADAFGVTITWDGSAALDINLSSVTLSGGNLAAPVVDGAPGFFSFSGLASGPYQLALEGTTSLVPSRSGGLGWGVGYAGLLATSAPTIVTPVPEPETIAMLALGLLAVVASTRRKS